MARLSTRTAVVGGSLALLLAGSGGAAAWAADSPQPSTSPTSSTSAKTAPQGKHELLIGTVTKVSGSSVSIKTDTSGSRTVAVAPAPKAKQSLAKRLPVGTRVVAREKNGVWRAHAARMRVGGIVVSANKTSGTLDAANGIRYSLDLTHFKGKKPLEAGQHVRLAAKVSGDGTTLDVIHRAHGKGVRGHGGAHAKTGAARTGAAAS